LSIGRATRVTYQPAKQPTLYFIGVTTAKSSIMKVFPAWAEYLGLKDAVIRGIDFKLHDNPEAYRAAVEFIRDDPLSMGALVTTHKIDLFAACKDMFDVIDPHARLMDETSCISKRDSKLVCHAKDPISSGLAIDGFLGPDYFAGKEADLFSIGAGGSTIALTWHLMRRSRESNVPRRIVVSNRSQHRLDEIRRIHESIESDVPVDYVLAPKPEDNDAVLTGSLGWVRTLPARPSRTPRSFPSALSPGTSTIGAIWSFSNRRGRRKRAGRCRSKMVGPISSMAGRR
jgi:shikimate 5-dehydrogenase